MSIKQMAILSVVVVALVFLVTYAAVYLGEGSKPGGSVLPGPPTKVALKLDETVYGPGDANAQDPDRKDKRAPIVERNKPGHHDFWFENDSGAPVKVGLVERNCKCAQVEIGVLPEEKWKSG